MKTRTVDYQSRTIPDKVEIAEEENSNGEPRRVRSMLNEVAGISTERDGCDGPPKAGYDYKILEAVEMTSSSMVISAESDELHGRWG